MVFSSLVFIFVYLVAVLAIYYITPLKVRNVFLLIINLIFYGWGEPIYVFLMLLSITVSYIFGLLVAKYREDEKRARRYLTASVVIHLSLLFFFKYFDFLISNLALIPIFSGLKPIGLALPIGISFYTFQSMSYVIDVYRRDTEAQPNFAAFGTYVSLYPQLIAGPIVRYKDVADQMITREHSVAKFSSGVQRFVIGLCKKVLLANSIGKLWDVYAVAGAGELSVFGAWLGTIAFTFQIYFDFAGYSDMAIGLGRMLGFEFLENFNYPYISRSITEFWRRWHISLGTWFREYVYIPLGGNRCSKARNFLNIFIVWMLTGIWHGAAWNFLLWGIYYALLLMLEKLVLLKWLKKAPPLLTHIYTMFLVVVGWAIFANEGLGQCGSYLATMFFCGGGPVFLPSDAYYLANYAVVLILCAVASVPTASTLMKKLPEAVRTVAAPVLIAAGLLLCTAYLVDATYNPFLYFRF